jgi:hypothetical protein
MLLLEKLKRDLRFTKYEMFEEFKGSKFNCLWRSKVQVLAALSSLRSVEEFEMFEGFRTLVLDLGFWILEFGIWILVFFYPFLIPKKN